MVEDSKAGGPEATPGNPYRSSTKRGMMPKGVVVLMQKARKEDDEAEDNG